MATPDTVALVATKNYPYGDKRILTGETFEAPEKDAALLLSLGMATRALEPDSGDEPKAKRRYKRRDLEPDA